MALLNFEGFDSISNGADFNTNGGIAGWSNFQGPASKSAGFLGGSCINGGSQFWYTYTTGLNSSQLIMGFRYRLTNGYGGTFAWFGDGATNQVTVYTNANGTISVNRGATVLATSTRAMMQSTWYLFEIKVTFSTTVGTIDVHMDTESWISASSLNTANSGVGQAGSASFGANGGGTGFFDDWYLCDNTTGVANNFLGTERVETLFPTANNTVTWTPHTSTNVSQVQETTYDGDATYNVSSSSAQTDNYTHGSLAYTPTTIYGVIVQSWMRKDDNTSQTGKTQLISGATTQPGAALSLATSYQQARDLYINDPNTSAAWASAAAVNGTIIGYTHV